MNEASRRLGCQWWPVYGDSALAGIRRLSRGRYMPTLAWPDYADTGVTSPATRWPDYADSEVAGLRRSLTRAVQLDSGAGCLRAARFARAPGDRHLFRKAVPTRRSARGAEWPIRHRNHSYSPNVEATEESGSNGHLKVVFRALHRIVLARRCSSNTRGRSTATTRRTPVRPWGRGIPGHGGGWWGDRSGRL